MTAATSQPPKLRQLRVFRVVTAALKYCMRDLGPLFVATWFACALASAVRLLLEWLVFRDTPLLPDWFYSDHFYPPTWLAALLLTPFLAMGWAFVLNEMFDTNPRRGVVTTAAGDRGWLRFELSRAVLIAAAIFCVVNLIDGFSRLAQQHILIAADVDPLGNTAIYWLAALAVVRVAFMAFVFTFAYPLAGMVLDSGSFSLARVGQVLRGNWWRVTFIFLLLTAVLRGIDLVLEPATNWLVGMLSDSTGWNLRAAVIRFVIDFPFQMLWIVAWAVTVGIVLHTLEHRTTPIDRDSAPTAT